MSKKLKLDLVDVNEDYQLLIMNITGNGVLPITEIVGLNLPKEHNYEKGIVLYGRAPIWLYSYLVHLCHPYAWVATFDPREGAIVVQTHSLNKNVGDVISNDEILKYVKKYEQEKQNKEKVKIQNKAVAIVGPPHSGKSVFLQLLKNHFYPEYNDDFFIFRACPDGEGNWSTEIPPEVRDAIRVKKVFDDDFPLITANQIEQLSKSKKLLLVDCGGIIDKKNQIIMNACNSAIIISSKVDEICEWLGACKSSDLEIIAIIESVWENSSQVISEKPLRFRIGKFDRNNLQDVSLPEKLLETLNNYLV